MNDEEHGSAWLGPEMLGELGLRVNDLAAMRAFYRDVVGLEVWRDFGDYVFFAIAEGVEGHPQVLVLFDRGVEVGPPKTSTLDHLAFVINVDDYDRWMHHLEDLGLLVTPKEFSFAHWRALFINDPEGNTIEFVCYDPRV
jgi:catechol-2,3-dioxygenase